MPTDAEERADQLYDRMYLQIGDLVNRAPDIMLALDRIRDGVSPENALADSICELVCRFTVVEDTLLIEQFRRKAQGGPQP